MSQTVLITGGNKGIGLAAARLFLKGDYRIYILGRDFSKLDAEIEKGTEKVPFDLRRVEEIPALIQSLEPIDILINNAGILLGIFPDQYTEEMKRDMLKVNLEAPVALMTEVSKSMRQKKKGRIVNVASIAGEIGYHDIWYGITKAGIINATKGFARVLGPEGILVNAVAPSIVETDMRNKIPDWRQKAVLNSVFAKRFLKPEEVASAIYWLAVECPEYINGITLDINSGAYLR